MRRTRGTPAPSRRPVRRVPAPSRRDGVRWWLGRHRRPLAAACAAVAVWAGLAAVRARPADETPVVVAARDLPPGTVLAAADLRTVELPAGTVPPSAYRPADGVAGRTVAVAVPAGVPLTPASLSVGRVLPAGTVAVPVRLADPAAAALVHAGDRVDVLAATGDQDTAAASGSASGPSASVVARGVPVLSVPAPDDRAGDQGGLVVVAATPDQAADLARAATSARLSVTVHGS